MTTAMGWSRSGSLSHGQGGGEQAQNGGQGGHQDGPDPAAAGLHDGVPFLHSFQAELVDRIDKDDAVIDHHAREDQEAQHGHHAQIEAQDPQGQQAAVKARGMVNMTMKGESRDWNWAAIMA